MRCKYFGQDILAFSVGLASYICTQIRDIALLNLIGDLFMLVGQQIVTIAGAREYFCPEDSDTNAPTNQISSKDEQTKNKKP